METSCENLDDVMTSVNLGLWQALPILTFLLIHATYSSQFIAAVFTNMPVRFRCTENISDHIVQRNVFDNKLLNDRTVLNDIIITEDIDYLVDISLSNDSEIINNDDLFKYGIGHKDHGPCATYEFDKSVFSSTFTSEFGLVGEQSWLSPLYKLSGFIGVIVGSTLTGFSDRYGRVTIIRVVAFVYLTGVLLVGLAPQIYIVLVSRFIVGCCYEVLNASSFTLMMEVLPQKYRSLVGGISSNLSNTLFTILIGVISYFVREWRILHLILSSPIYILILVIFFLDKSPRWLVDQGLTEEAITVLEKAARMNKNTLPTKEDLLSIMNNLAKEKSDNQGNKPKTTWIQVMKTLVSSTAMCILTFVTPLIWFFTAMVYWAIPLNANNFTDNPFLYIIMIGLADIPPNIFGPLLVKKFGNINTSTVMYIITMVCLVSVIFITEILWLKWCIVIIAMTIISVNYMICYVISSELFPTSVRTITFGMCSLSKHSGILLASFITDIASAEDISWLMNAISGISCIIVSILIRLLPETQNEPLCDTIDDVNQRRKRQKGKSQVEDTKL